MSSLGSPSPFFLAGKKAYEVERSLRFNRNDNAYLTRTPSSAGNRKTFTFSAWVKLGQTGISTSNDPGNGLFLSTGAGSGGANMTYRITNNGYIGVDYYGVGGYYSTARLRDPSAWYHCVWVMDTTESTAVNRFKVYVNGDLIYNNQLGLSQNADTPLNNNSSTTIGAYSYSTSHAYRLDGYLAEVNFIDGFAYGPSYFGETNPTTGQWNPKKYVGSYGTNGFYLNFSDNSGTTATTLGKDSSGNGNNFTPNNFSVSAGTGNDSLKDTPTNNFATFNAALPTGSSSSYSNGNLQFEASVSDFRQTRSTFAHDSGKWYAEFKLESFSHAHGSYPYIGVAAANTFAQTWVGEIGTAVNRIGTAYKDGSSISGGFSFTSGDIIGMALDVDNLLVYFYKNGTIQNSGTGFAITANINKGYQFALNIWATAVWTANFGGIGIGSNSDANGHGNFTYAVPSGYLAECSANLPDPTILLPNQHFNTLLYTGNASYPRTITGLQFQPDWFWSKTRNQAYGHAVFDSVRGTGSAKGLRIDTTAGEGSNDIAPFIDLTSFNFTSGTDGGFTFAQPSNAVDVGNGNGLNFATWNWNAGDTDGKTYTVKVVSDSGNKYRFDNFGTSAVTLDLAEGGTYIFDQSHSSNATHPLRFYTAADKTGGEYTTGVTTSGTAGSSGATVTITIAASAPTLYYQCSAHAGMGGQVNTNSTLGSSNFDGSRQATTKVNTTSGFSIISWTGTGSNLTVGHGLGVAPKTYIVKARTGSSGCDWYVYHKEIGATHNVRLNLTDASSATSDLFNNTEPTSTVLSIGNSSCINENNGTYITYAFSEVAGYSKFGSYTGNGATDGTFVFTGFRPAWIMTKRTDSSSDWYIYDNKRPEFNVNNILISPHNARAEISYVSLDVLSNGFKLRNTGTDINASGGTFIYLAFAESPFKNARAR